jgi:hypothetical protein
MLPETVVVAGALAQKPQQGGHTWQFLQYLLGFKRLGWKVLFLDQLRPEVCVDAAGKPCDVEHSENLRYCVKVMKGFGLEDAFAVVYDKGQSYFGLSRPIVVERIKQSACLLNFMGFIDDETILEHAPRRVFLDTDPGFGQMWSALGLTNLFTNHDVYVTIGENIGQPNCTIPTCGINWITTSQPVILDEWPLATVTDSGWITSIGSWRGAYGPVEYQDKIYGLRVHEFRKFIELPKRSGKPLQLALQVHPAEIADLERLNANGWSLVMPTDVASDPWVYQRYLQQSHAEFMVAKNMYVQSHSGWFSERSMCYLASGKPVLAQDTGIRGHYPTGEGLLIFTTLDEALEGIEALARDYTRHARAARELAEEYFDSDKVLTRLLGKIGVA